MSDVHVLVFTCPQLAPFVGAMSVTDLSLQIKAEVKYVVPAIASNVGITLSKASENMIASFAPAATNYV